MMKLEINPKYNMLASFVRTIPEQFDDLGLVIYEGRNILAFSYKNVCASSYS